MDKDAKSQVLSLENLKQEYGDPDYQNSFTVVEELFRLLADGELSDAEGQVCIAAIEELSIWDEVYASRPCDTEIDYFYIQERVPKNIPRPITNKIDRKR